MFTSRVGWSAVFCSLLLVGCGDPPPDQTPPDMSPVTLPDRPGALVDVSMAGRVGVLIEELPTAQREAAAAQLLAQPLGFWEARARAQMALTTYRLVFRTSFYQGKGQLPTPPPDQWHFEFDAGGATRTTVDGHDLVVMDYTFTSTLVTDVDSPGLADEALAEVGGTWNEPFVLPVDPELLLQRTAYACMDEADFPPNSVDGENVATFYDWQCTAQPNNCHITRAATEDCVEALQAHVGSLQTELTFTRVDWDPAKAQMFRSGTVSNATGADLEVIGEGLENHRVIYRYIPADSCAIAEGCVGGSGWRRLLQFDASVKNVGPVALNIGDVDFYLDGRDTPLSNHHIFEYSACHMHHHFTHYGNFTYGGHDGDKRAFCLQSTNRYANHEYSPLTNPFGSCEFQGIEAGWGDDYGAGIECQWIDVTDVDTSAGPVTQPLVFDSNVDQFLCEGNLILDGNGDPTFVPTSFSTPEGDTVDRLACDFVSGWNTNNRQERDAILPVTGGLINTPCTRGQLGPRRDCGYTEQTGAGATIACTPGAAVTLSCSVANPALPQVVRVCERSTVLGAGTACVFLDALANEIVGAPTPVSLTCPTARDATEPGGALTLYAAPVLPSDAAQAVTCVIQ